MDDFYSKLTYKSRQTIELLCVTAQKGLADCYPEQELFKKGTVNHGTRLSMCSHLRYIIIAQIGIKRWQHIHGDNNPSPPDLWKYILSKSHLITSAGDIGLLIWAGAESNAVNSTVPIKYLVNNWTRLRETCNAVELAWVIQGMVRLSECQSMIDETTYVLKDAHSMLMKLYCHNTGLFARHNRKGLKEAVSHRIACFADQVYPILALANYGQLFNDTQSINSAITASDTICRLQGNGGQWWWHYDVKRGTIAEEYPVFSVHQDGMAPMALLAIDKAAGTNHIPYIEKGLTWLCRQNERNEDMILHNAGIIYRDIHRREIHKMYRLTRGSLSTAGLLTAHRLTGRALFGYTVNRECRPYHLGWILYAWADFKSN
jgi:hypothetical protein